MVTETKPDFDLTYSIDDFEAGTHRDSQYLYCAIEDAVVDLATETPGGTVLDPMAGSGSTLVAARDSGRTAIGVEISERYAEVAARRLDQGSLFAGDGPKAAG